MYIKQIIKNIQTMPAGNTANRLYSNTNKNTENTQKNTTAVVENCQI